MSAGPDSQRKAIKDAMSSSRIGAADRSLGAGDRLGRYQLLKRLAVGGMAEIFLARSSGLDGFEKLVVLKCILMERAGDSAWVEMFLDEARLAATLAHPNVAQVFDVGRDRELHFFTMEYVQGADLREVTHAASSRGGIPLEVALTIVLGVAAGLHYAHEKTDHTGRPLKIVHRDVSPSNVLVSYDGAVKIVDFGIAKAAVRRAATRTGTVKGKAGYMSPEQCRGEPLDRRSDVFAIGVLLYELVTGVAPFDDENEYAIIKKVVDEDVRPPSQIVAGLSPRLEAIVLRALSRARDGRYATAQELQIDLETYAREASLSLSTVDLGRFMQDVFGSRRVQDVEALSALLGADGVRALSRTFALLEPQPRNGRIALKAGIGAVALAALGIWVLGSRARPTTSESLPVANVPNRPEGNPAMLRRERPPEAAPPAPVSPPVVVAPAVDPAGTSAREKRLRRAEWRERRLKKPRSATGEPNVGKPRATVDDLDAPFPR